MSTTTMPEGAGLIHSARGLFKMMETAFSYAFHAYHDHRIYHPAFNTTTWLNIPYRGLVSHDALERAGLALNKWFSGRDVPRRD
ncbi:hypothetical protein B0T20DRAFT_222192 [Sordaria brevicollis]|uniref:Uncharacterized protein n=1 Tax=Sordaria brevicollis TaxID=83679 RepID=A0AAE0PCP7_SORBR|nr:hypothetical protein B0T20DRAFT_222192 [Sordaria brevicollis]